MPLPLGEVSPKVTERARTLTRDRRHGDGIALTKGVLIAARRLRCSWLALSGASRQLSQGESLNESHHTFRASSSRLRLGTQ